LDQRLQRRVLARCSKAGKFVEQQGLVPEYIRFADVNGPTKADPHPVDRRRLCRAHERAFTLGIQGAPIEIVLATQIAEATLVAKTARRSIPSPISRQEARGLAGRQRRLCHCRRRAGKEFRAQAFGLYAGGRQ